MNTLTYNNDNKPIEVFTGKPWEVALVQCLPENAKIMAYVYYGGRSTLAPLDTVGGIPLNRITVSSEDFEKTKQVVGQFYKALKG